MHTTRVSDGLRDIEPEQLVSVYAKRMTIEESFRDLKSQRWGFAGRYADLASAACLILCRVCRSAPGPATATIFRDEIASPS